MLVPVIRGGELTNTLPSIEVSRARTAEQLAMLDPSVKRFLNPHRYTVGVEQSLYDLRKQLILKARGLENEGGTTP
jgi:nicotinate phosphoribosyltransferase